MSSPTHQNASWSHSEAIRATNPRRGKNPAMSIPGTDHPWRQMIVRTAKSGLATGERTKSLNPYADRITDLRAEAVQTLDI